MEERVKCILLDSPEQATWTLWDTAVRKYVVDPWAEPQDQPTDAEKPPNLNSPPGTIVQAGKPVQVMNVGNQQVVMQQAPGAVSVQPNQVVSVRTANGQIVQV